MRASPSSFKHVDLISNLYYISHISSMIVPFPDNYWFRIELCSNVLSVASKDIIQILTKRMLKAHELMENL